MKLTVGEKTYTKLRDLKFDPAADVRGSEVPINEFSVSVVTADDIDAMQYAWLYDDTDKLWAKYWIVYADRADKNTVTVKAQSSLKLLERRMLDAHMYQAQPAAAVIADIFDELGADSYVLDSSFASATLTGLVPYQSCKTRLQWVCFVLGAYIKSFFSEKIEILPVQQTPKIIPMERVYHKPNLVYAEYITRISVTAYSYQQGTPATTDTWVEADGNVYIQTQLNHGIRNPDVPTEALTHETHFTGITLVNDDNVDEILARLGPSYFRRVSAEFQAINNGDYLPGDRVMVFTDQSHVVEGFIEQIDCSFGLQAASKMTITPAVSVECALLTVVSKYGNITISRAEYWWPIGYPYDIEIPWLDETWLGTRYILKPSQDSITGTLTEDGATVEIEYTPALEFHDGDLRIVSVDDYSVTDGTVKIE